MDRNEAITNLRKASAACALWTGIADDGIIGTLTANVEHSAALSLRSAAVQARECGVSVDEIANEALIPYRTAFFLTIAG